jgi:cytochrome c oxidase subunit II
MRAAVPSRAQHRSRRLGAAAVVSLCVSGCGGWQSALETHGSQADDLKHLILLFTAVCAVIWLLVIAALVLAVARRRTGEGVAPELRPDRDRQRRMTRIVAVCVAATVLVLVGLTTASFFATRSYYAEAGEALTVRVTGFQWWWEVTYPDAVPGRSVVTANEIHIPVGQPVRIELVANDVIHSLWIPSLAGKRDMIPGRDTSLTFTAEREGVYRGQCAEFCGMQHAHMAILVVAEAPDAFARWKDAQLAAAATPADEEARAGLALFTRSGCASCHTVRGTPAAGAVGPDLTHVASRQTIAAGLLPVTRGSLAAWIADPQTLKPGNTMPMTPLAPEELRAVSAYVAGLK